MREFRTKFDEHWCFREIHVVTLSITFNATLIISLIISFIVFYLAHRPRLALAMPSSFCLLNYQSFNCPVTPVTCRPFTCKTSISYSRPNTVIRCVNCTLISPFWLWVLPLPTHILFQWYGKIQFWITFFYPVF
jgi:hypothetical protein